MEQRRNARAGEREIPEKTRWPTESSQRPGTKIRGDPGGKESHTQSPNAENRNSEAKEAVLDLDPTPGMVCNSVDTLMLTLPFLYFMYRKIISAIVETLLFCGRQEISLRGYRDFGRLTVEEPTNNDGNFRALLRLQARAGDSLLNEHLNSGRGNAMYVSPTVQNELLSLNGKKIQETVVERIKRLSFSLYWENETTYMSRVEQFSLCVRCVDIDVVDIREDFLTFVPVYDVTELE
ncbi:hypothetical protein PR048_025712 [Dryococelus australis]|uniref:Uncharacterized protein n=1 Tax=Dryococelus australis TaxID=614101 RepID=A0ABQ9GJC0_9NEOP|nr:hypothetical protein PR048_025712 [Dryococelus australis]